MSKSVGDFLLLWTPIATDRPMHWLATPLSRRISRPLFTRLGAVGEKVTINACSSSSSSWAVVNPASIHPLPRPLLPQSRCWEGWQAVWSVQKVWVGEREVGWKRANGKRRSRPKWDKTGMLLLSPSNAAITKELYSAGMSFTAKTIINQYKHMNKPANKQTIKFNYITLQ